MYIYSDAAAGYGHENDMILNRKYHTCICSGYIHIYHCTTYVPLLHPLLCLSNCPGGQEGSDCLNDSQRDT
jgi:hypothetical protein